MSKSSIIEQWPSAYSGTHLQGRAKEHRFVFSMARRSNGKLFNVRCTCMAEYRNVSDRYFNYDTLAVVENLATAKAVYLDHLRSEGVTL